MSTLPAYDDALARVLAATPVLPPRRTPLHAALGLRLVGEVRADRDQPPFDRSAMDGFAVRAAEVAPGRTYPILGSVAAGGAAASFQEQMPPGSVRRIATGAPLPAGADAVVPVEQADAQPGDRIAFRVDRVEPGKNVHRRASDAAGGGVVLPVGVRVGPQHVGVAAAAGAVELLVAPRPRVAVLTSGDEVLPPETPADALGPQQIRNSNGPMLAAFFACLGAAPAFARHVPDDPEATLAAARAALSEADLVVTVGGASVGERDYLPRAAAALGLETVVHGVNIQPGKPVFVARGGGGADKMVVGLPGNPVSVLVTAHLFALPVFRRMMGEPPELPWRPVPLAGAARGGAKRQVFRAARLTAAGGAEIVGWHGSGDLMHTAAAEALVRLPLTDEPVSEGTVVPVLPLVSPPG